LQILIPYHFFNHDRDLNDSLPLFFSTITKRIVSLEAASLH
jgi:hypothetical protein